MKIKKGDNVIMLSGKDKGKKGKVSQVLILGTEDRAGQNKVVVEGLNMIKRHIRARREGQKGQVVNKERAVSVSSVAIICKSCGKPTRIAYKIEGDVKTRICRKCGAEI